MIGTPLFLNNLNYTHTIENVNKIKFYFEKSYIINKSMSKNFTQKTERVF